MEVMGYLILQSFLVPSTIKGELPDIKYRFVSNTSDIGFHFDFTRIRKDAYTFDANDFTYEEVKEYAELLEMKVQPLY